MYHIIEIQSYNHHEGEQWSVKPSTIVTPIPQFEDMMEAKAAYHQKLYYAYSSKVDMHTVAGHRIRVRTARAGAGRC